MTRLYLFLGCTYFVAAVLGPDIPFAAASVNFRIEDVVIVLMLLLAFPLLTIERRPTYISKPIAVGLCLLLISCLMSGWYNVMAGNYFDVSFFLKEVIRFIKYAIVYFVFMLFVKKEDQTVLVKLFLAVSMASVGIQLAQYWNLFNINHWLSQHWGEEIFYAYTSSQHRVSGGWSAGSTFANKNVYGNFLLIPFAYALGVFLNSLSGKPAHDGRRSFWPGFTSIILLGGVMLTQSRTALVAVVILITMMLILSRWLFASRSRYRVASLTTLTVGVVVSIIIVHSFNLSEIFDIAGGLEKSGSMTAKISLFRDVVSRVLSQSPLLGLSPGAEPLQVDFEYGYLLYWYGLIGVLAYFAFVFLILKQLFRYKNTDIQAVVLISITISFLVFGLTATSFLNNRVFPPFLALISMYLSQRTFQHRQSK